MKNDSHRGMMIKNKLEGLFKSFDIKDKVSALIRDGASNVTLAGALLRIDNWDCLSHKLNLAAKQGCKVSNGVGTVLEKLKKIIKKIRKSDQLRGSSNISKPFWICLYLCSEKNCEVRWTSLYDMLQRALTVKEALSLLIARYPTWPSLTVSEWEIMEAVCSLLQPMVEAVKFTEHRGMTASAVIPLVKLMISDMESAAEYPAAAQAIANKLKMELQKYEEVEYLNIATALDPRFKLMFVSQSWRQRLTEILLNGDDPTDATLSCAFTSSDDPFQKYVEKRVPVAPATVISDRRVLIVAISGVRFLWRFSHCYNNFIALLKKSKLRAQMLISSGNRKIFLGAIGHRR